MKTNAAVLYETGKPLVIEELEIPKLKRGQVLVKILSTGLCHSQLNEIYATKGKDNYLPHTLGHEASGIVISLGEGIIKVKEGDYVVASWIKGSGADSEQTTYRNDNRETINSGAVTTFLQYSIIHENRLTKISKEVPPNIAALFGCAVPTGGGIILNEIDLTAGKNLAIFGIGGIGASALLVAASLNSFSEIIAVDINQEKLKYAKELGATQIINASEENVVEKIKKITGGIGTDYSIEAAGSKKAMEEAFESLKEGHLGKEGGLMILAGNIPKGEKIEIYPFDLIKGKRIKGSWGGKTNPDKDIPIYQDMYLSGKLPLEKLITHKYQLKDINLALEDFSKGKCLRTIIEVNKDEK